MRIARIQIRVDSQGIIIIIIIIIMIIIIWFGDAITVSYSTKCDTYSKVRALS